MYNFCANCVLYIVHYNIQLLIRIFFSSKMRCITLFIWSTCNKILKYREGYRCKIKFYLCSIKIVYLRKEIQPVCHLIDVPLKGETSGPGGGERAGCTGHFISVDSVTLLFNLHGSRPTSEEACVLLAFFFFSSCLKTLHPLLPQPQSEQEVTFELWQNT